MKAELKRLHSPDIADLRSFMPAAPDRFSFLLQMIVGPFGQEGEESFDAVVCTPSWLKIEVDRCGIMAGKHYIFMNTYNYDKLVKYIESCCNKATGDSWQEIAEQLQCLGRWEFENYQP